MAHYYVPYKKALLLPTLPTGSVKNVLYWLDGKTNRGITIFFLVRRINNFVTDWSETNITGSKTSNLIQIGMSNSVKS